MIRRSRDGEVLIWTCVSVLGAAVILTQVSWMGVKSMGPSNLDLGTAPPIPPSMTILAPAPHSLASQAASELDSFEVFVEALIQVESGGNPSCVGLAGERGLMQIKHDTWEDTVRWLYSEDVPFDLAFEPERNREVGIGYLVYLDAILHDHAEEWRAAERLALLAACYNAGPGAVQRAGFRLDRLPLSTQRYVERVTALYGHLASEAAPASAAEIESITALADRRL